jgi:hypothetical protein
MPDRTVLLMVTRRTVTIEVIPAGCRIPSLITVCLLCLLLRGTQIEKKEGKDPREKPIGAYSALKPIVLK